MQATCRCAYESAGHSQRSAATQIDRRTSDMRHTSSEDKQQSHNRWRGRTKCERMKGNLGAKIPLHGSQACESRHMPYKHSMTQRDPAVGAAGHDMFEGKSYAS